MVGSRTALFSRNQPGGLFAIQDLETHPGDVYFVDSGAAGAGDTAGHGGNPDKPFATLDYAFSQCTANKGDVIYVMPGHAETTTLIGLDVAGVRVIGLGVGASRPTFTATTAASDLAAVTAASIEIRNLRFVGAASGVTALLDVGAADFVARRCSFEQAATPLDGVTIGAASHRFVFEDCVFMGSANGPDRAISIEAKSHDWRVTRCRFLYGQAGLDNELIKSVKACLGYVVEDIVAVGIDALVINFASSSAGAPDGLITGGTVMYSAAVTSIEDGVAAATSKGAAFGRLYATDATGKAGGLIPLTTAS